MPNLKFNLSDTDTITRFIKDKNYINKKGSAPKITADAFVYPKTEKEISMAHINDLPEFEIWGIGDNGVFKNSLSKTKARADINVGSAKNLGITSLTILRDNLEFNRHVTVSSEMEKTEFAHLLSVISKTVIRTVS